MILLHNKPRVQIFWLFEKLSRTMNEKFLGSVYRAPHLSSLRSSIQMPYSLEVSDLNQNVFFSKFTNGFPLWMPDLLVNETV